VNEYGNGSPESVVLCSGKVFFDIDAKIKAANVDHKKIKVIRVEELAPFPVKKI
jgi:2-oxoglutarate dehydrogenase complex dehydrogenase (E1) component-like enzyme